MEALVFVHGYLGGGSQWKDQVDYFGDRYNVVTPDLPGFGNNHENIAPDRIEDYAEFVLDHLSDQGINRFHLVGHSMGGMVVQEMAKLAPKRIKRLILYGTGPVGALPGRFEPISKSKQRAVDDGIDVTGRRISATWFLQGDQARSYSVCANLAVKVSLETMLAGLTAMEKWSGIANIANVTSPTLVLWGDQDRTYPWSQPEQLWKELPKASLAVIPGCAHAVHLEKPSIFNSILIDFLAAPEMDL